LDSRAMRTSKANWQFNRISRSIRNVFISLVKVN
jgi:hypothetical protein